MRFRGYRRNDGRIGIRNHVLILPASICASDVAHQVTMQVQGTVSFHNQLGCSQTPIDQECTLRTMAGMAANPNVYGTIIISLGCENCQMKLVTEEIQSRCDKPLKAFIIQECGGTLHTVEQAVRCAREMVAQASCMQREEADVSELMVAMECGGSDPTSGLAANPLVGEVADSIIASGGTAVLSETTEFIGAEKLLAKRAVNAQVSAQILEIVRHYEDAMKCVNDDVRKRNPSPGNKAGGITTLEEKSLGCIYKSGHSPIQAVYDYAQDIHHKGLVIMDTPGNDPISMSGMAAGGCQLVLFTTGRGTPTGNPIVPVIKLSANRDTAVVMRDNLDFDASGYLYGSTTMRQLRDALLEEICAVAGGKLTRSEILGYCETAIARVGRYVKNEGEMKGCVETYYY